MSTQSTQATPALLSTRVIVLNGGSSSGKSSIARRLQVVLTEPWLTFGVDTLIDALPPALRDGDGDGIAFGDDGSVDIGEDFAALDSAWILGIAAMAHAGARIIVDEAFISGPPSQRRLRNALAGLPVLWVGVRCDAAVAATREAARGDRATGMAELQAELVHRGIDYDLVVDTTERTVAEAADAIAAAIEAHT